MLYFFGLRRKSERKFKYPDSNPYQTVRALTWGLQIE